MEVLYLTPPPAKPDIFNQEKVLANRKDSPLVMRSASNLVLALLFSLISTVVAGAEDL